MKMITIGRIQTGHNDIQYGWQNNPNSAGGVSTRITFRNDTNKVIKYIVFVTKPHNAVNDIVASQYSHQNGRLQCTGPINPQHVSKNIFWENCWYNHSITGAIIESIELTYMDGSFEVISGSDIKNDPSIAGGCYVATAVYGSYDCPEVWTLRRYRDNTLAESIFGRAFIHTYYAISPTLVKWFGKTQWFKTLFKGKLDKMVKSLNEKGIEDTPYEDKNWK